MSTLIKVSNNDIQNGVRKDASNCPVLLALERAYNTKCLVGVNFISVLQDRGYDIYTIPESVKDVIYAYDMGQDMKPFWFILHDPIEKS